LTIIVKGCECEATIEGGAVEIDEALAVPITIKNASTLNGCDYVWSVAVEPVQPGMVVNVEPQSGATGALAAGAVYAAELTASGPYQGSAELTLSVRRPNGSEVLCEATATVDVICPPVGPCPTPPPPPDPTPTPCPECPTPTPTPPPMETPTPPADGHAHAAAPTASATPTAASARADRHASSSPSAELL
jgi:hypothetical protein